MIEMASALDVIMRAKLPEFSQTAAESFRVLADYAAEVERFVEAEDEAAIQAYTEGLPVDRLQRLSVAVEAARTVVNLRVPLLLTLAHAIQRDATSGQEARA